VAALERTVTLAEVAHVAVLVGDDLDLDVTWVLEVALEIHRVVVEVGLALALGALELVFDFALVPDDLHPAAATATFGLDGDRVAVFLTELFDLLGVGDGFGRPGDDRHVGLVHDRPGFGLLTECFHRVAGRADPGDPLGLLDLAGELGVFGEEAVAGVDGVGVGLACSLDHGLVIEIRVSRSCRTDVVRLVRVADVPRVLVGLGVDGDSPDIQLFTRPHDADGDLPAVGHENLPEHSCRNRREGPTLLFRN